MGRTTSERYKKSVCEFLDDAERRGYTLEIAQDIGLALVQYPTMQFMLGYDM